jgi:hypothetical protein
MYSINKKQPTNIRKYLIYPITEGILLALLALVLTSVTAFFIYHHALAAIEAEIKDGLLRTASGIAACLDGDLIASFDKPEKKDFPSYQQTIKLLQKARLATKHCTYLYVNRLVDGKVVFILDPTPVDENGKPIFTDAQNLAPSIPMTKYEEPSLELTRALTTQKKVVTANPYTDKWGTFYSAFIPIFDSQNVCIGTLGADIRINDMLKRLEPIEDATKRAFFVSITLAILCGTLIWFTRRFSLQLNESRFAILENLQEAKGFADQSTYLLGKQLQRTGRIFENLAQRLITIKGAKDSAEIVKQLEIEQQKLLTLADKLYEVGKLKLSPRETDLNNFSLEQTKENVAAIVAKKKLDFDRINIDFDPMIPKEFYGPVKIYEELLSQMLCFFLKMFSLPVRYEVKLDSEEPDSVTLHHKVTAAIETLGENKIKLLKHLAREAGEEDFFAELEQAEATAVPILRELIFLLNSDLHIAIDENSFSISFLNQFNKSLEPEDEEQK